MPTRPADRSQVSLPPAVPMQAASAGMLVSRAWPLVLGGAVGHLYAPQAGAIRHCVLVCPSFGAEALFAHRVWVALAQDLNARGVALLLMDFEGQGNAADLPHEADAIGAWVDGLGRAAHWLRQRFPGRGISLLGHRLGGLLAVRALAALPFVEQLMLIAPPPSGRQYLRELRLAVGGEASSADSTGIHPDGWWLSGASMQALGALSLERLIDQAAQLDLLILADTGLRRLQTLCSEMQEVAPQRRHQALEAEDLQRMRADAQKLSLPRQSLDRLAAWLFEGLTSPLSVASSADALAGAAVLTLPTGREQLLRFGPDGRLFGVLAQADGAATAGLAGRCVLILNTGANPCSGHHRFSVRLARELAARGLASFRIDLTGMGDTLPPLQGPHLTLDGVAQMPDVIAAMDFLGQQGWQRVSVYGICAGAYLGLHTAYRDVRITDLMLVNPLRLQWPEEHRAPPPAADSPVQIKQVNRYYRQLFSADFWRRLLKGQVNLAAVSVQLLRYSWDRHSGAWLAMLPAFVARNSRIRKIHRGLNGLLARGVRVQLIFSATDPGVNDLEISYGARGWRLARRRGVELQLVDGADHTFTLPQDSDRLLSLLLSHLLPESQGS